MFQFSIFHQLDANSHDGQYWSCSWILDADSHSVVDEEWFGASFVPAVQQGAAARIRTEYKCNPRKTSFVVTWMDKLRQLQKSTHNKLNTGNTDSLVELGAKKVSKGQKYLWRVWVILWQGTNVWMSGKILKNKYTKNTNTKIHKIWDEYDRALMPVWVEESSFASHCCGGETL